MQELFRDIEIRMKQAVDHFHEELKQLRTGRATTAILDGVVVDYYGTATPLNQLANVAVADASLVTAQPYDPTQIGAIEKAIHASGLGLNPSNDGKIVRIPIPPLTEERRRDLVRVAHDMAEKTRNSIRQSRREGNDQLKSMEKQKQISQDDEKRGHDEVQKLHDHYIAETNQTLEAKERDIMEV
ncbi:MAG TPA: ribosome recycling factor [Thermoanaerobaculia bacterium]|nr:ribosome recycling factor [Thermoanaerobaculia bacterium]